jgi:hypothetical protein
MMQCQGLTGRKKRCKSKKKKRHDSIIEMYFCINHGDRNLTEPRLTIQRHKHFRSRGYWCDLKCSECARRLIVSLSKYRHIDISAKYFCKSHDNLSSIINFDKHSYVNKYLFINRQIQSIYKSKEIHSVLLETILPEDCINMIMEYFSIDEQLDNHDGKYMRYNEGRDVRVKYMR